MKYTTESAKLEGGKLSLGWEIPCRAPHPLYEILMQHSHECANWLMLSAVKFAKLPVQEKLYVATYILYIKYKTQS